MNKTDLISEEEKHRLRRFLEKLNPGAWVFETNFGKIELSKILDTRLFKFKEAEEREEWLKEARYSEHIPETLEYSVASFVFKAKKPFHPQRLYKLLYQSEIFKPVVRSKGFVWLATQNREFVVWSQAGSLFRFSIGGSWWACTSKNEWPTDKKLVDAINSDWDSVYGDRHQELVVIGIAMDKELVSCLNCVVRH